MNLSGRYKYVTRDEGGGDYYIALELSSPQADDAATYKVHAQNDHGASNASLTLNFGGEYHKIIVLRRSNQRIYRYFENNI